MFIRNVHLIIFYYVNAYSVSVCDVVLNDGHFLPFVFNASLCLIDYRNIGFHISIFASNSVM